ncbi:MAG: SGNH/GDSL hydrolase family protein [Anaerolineae bacterium]
MTDTTSMEPASPRRRRLFTTAAVLLLSLLVSLLLAEGLVRLANSLGLVDLSASLAELPAAGAEDGVQLDAAGGQQPLYLSDQRLHHRMAANWSGFFPEEIVQVVGRSQVPIRTNSLGLRSADVAEPKPADVLRILALGDSVTFGWGLRGEDTYPSQLASLLATLRPEQRFEVVNAGVSGYGAWQHARWLEQTGLDMQPDVVVVQAHLNDAADDLWGALGQQSGQQGGLARHSLLVRLAQRVLGSAAPASSAPCADDWKVGVDQVCWQRTEDFLDELHSQAAAAGAVTVLMPSPMRWQVEPGVRDSRAWVDAARYQEALRQYAQRSGWLFVDPLPAFRKSQAENKGESLFLDVGHPNEAGQRLIAQEIYSALHQAGALP